MPIQASSLWDAWSEISTRLPSDLDLDELARTTRAIKRSRGDGITDGVTLLRLSLARGPGGKSLQDAAARARLNGQAGGAAKAVVRALPAYCRWQQLEPTRQQRDGLAPARGLRSGTWRVQPPGGDGSAGRGIAVALRSDRGPGADRRSPIAATPRPRNCRPVSMRPVSGRATSSSGLAGRHWRCGLWTTLRSV